MQEVKIVLKEDSILSVINTDSPGHSQQIHPKSESWVLRNTLLYWIPINDDKIEFNSSIIVNESFRSSLTILDVKSGLVLVNPIVSTVPINNDDVLFSIK